MISKIFFKLYQKIGLVRDRMSLLYYKHLWKQQLNYHPGFKLDSTCSIDIMSGKARVDFAQGVTFRRYCNILCSNQGVLTIGRDVFFNNYCSVNCLESITIGNDTIFGEGVKLYDHNHMFKDKQTLIREQGMKYGPISIGKNCWIGSNTIILANVTIGDNVVIGANNLIYKSVPAGTVVKAQIQTIQEHY